MNEKQTDAQHYRQRRRDYRTGRYENYWPCEVCGKRLREYWSDERVNGVFGGLGLVLCQKDGKRIAEIDDAAALALLTKERAE